MIRLDRSSQAAIIRHAESEYPCEACGLLLGRRMQDYIYISEVVPSPNLADQPLHNFEIDPRLRLRIQKASRESSNELIGHYHTHPDADAEPSATDYSRIFEPELIWIIGSVYRGRFSNLAAFTPSAQGRSFDKVALDWARDS